jgi:hypothetical protein
MDLEQVRVALWDVRAQWESGVRRLSSTQSSLEEWTARPAATGDGDRALLRGQVDALKEINATVRTLLADVERALS